ncbi:hypothetical protein [Solidesulfovibrio sp.]
MHGDALLLIGTGVAILALAVWNAMKPQDVIGSDVRLTPEREAGFDQEWP